VGVAAIILGLFLREQEGFVSGATSGATGAVTSGAIGAATSAATSATTAAKSAINITTCPSGSISYVTSEGNTNCCDGDIVNGVCNGTIMCSLSYSAGSKLKSCSDWISKEWVLRSTKFCATSIPYYFGTLNRAPGSEGCSASLPNEDGSAPRNSTLPQCIIYGNMTDELANVDSCYNVAAMDAMICPQADAKKSIISYDETMPAMLKCSYLPANRSSNGMPVDCMDEQRSRVFAGKNKDKRQQSVMLNDINSMRDVRFCGASKAYYVDRTLEASDAQSIPGSAGSCPTSA